LGETYILSDECSILFCTVKIGEQYEYYDFNFDEIEVTGIIEEKPFAYLDINAGNHQWHLKFAVFDLDTVNEIFKKCNKRIDTRTDAHDTASNEIPDNEVFELTPITGFCAALQAVAHINGEAAVDQVKNLELIIHDDAALRMGYNYWKQIGNEQLINKLTTLLSTDQKMCLMSNLLEIAMVDGVLEAKEKDFLEQMRIAFNIDAQEFNTIFDVLIIKNNLNIIY